MAKQHKGPKKPDTERLNDFYPEIRYKVASSTSEHIRYEPRYHLKYIEAEMFGTVFDEDGNEVEEVQLASGLFVYANLANFEMHFKDVLSPYSLTPYWGLFDEHGEFLDHGLMNLFVVDRVEVPAQYRGMGVAQMLIRDAISIFAKLDYDVVALKPFPLQFEGVDSQRKLKTPKEEMSEWRAALDLDSFVGTEKEATKKLKAHYKSMGFKNGKGSVKHLMYLMEW